MKELLEVQFSGWTATPRLPFVVSGNSVCLPTPTYSMLLGMIGCCLGRIVEANETEIGFHYSYDATDTDLETRHRMAFDGKLKPHGKGTDAHSREFHVKPVLTIWLSRTDWLEDFKYPIGTPALGRSQDLLRIKFKSVEIVKADSVPKAKISGCMIPFNGNLKVGGQLVQLAEAYIENEEIGSGRRMTNSGMFVSIPHDSNTEVEHESLYLVPATKEREESINMYLHTWSERTKYQADV
jgi:CRISPR-associated protein Cas5t